MPILAGAMSKQMAVIRDVQFGVGDYGEVALWFSAYTEPSLASLQVLTVDQGVHLIKTMGVRDVHDLDGKTVWVEADANTMRYLEPCKI